MSHHSTPSGLTNSTDVENKATVLVFVWYIFQEDVHEDMLCVLLFPTNTTAAELFKSSTSWKLNWSFCVGICTDGVAAVTGRRSGFTTKVKEVTSEWEFMPCVIHGEMLASQKVSPELKIFRMLLKWPATLKYMPLTHICSHSSVSRTHTSYTQKWDAFLKIDHWSAFLSYESCSRDFF